MDNAIAAKSEVPSLAKASAVRKKRARAPWAQEGLEPASRVWSKADLEAAAAGAPEHNVIRPVHAFGGLAAVSTAMQEVFDMLARFARTHVTLTLLGETGTGKDVLAHALHSESSRAAGPFVVFDCGAVAANLAESELLGHERGAFTGAVATTTMCLGTVT